MHRYIHMYIYIHLDVYMYVFLNSLQTESSFKYHIYCSEIDLLQF